ncbi:MAG: UDP-N-acetylglucosamine 2-epimerase [Phycisphaerales bacterium]
MIGPNWTDSPSPRPSPDPQPARRLRVAVITGSRAEFGLLRPVMRAIQHRPELELLVIAAGSHLISPAETYRDVKREFPIADAVPMQVAGRTTRADDIEALGRGVARFGRAFQRLAPDWVVLLGDRVEPFAAASAASVGGLALAHIHGGDRAEGIADEAMRHAITKLAHLHFPATDQSRERILRMGERPEHVHTVGSPAIDDLESIPPLPEAEFEDLGKPGAVFLLHPTGRAAEHEEMAASAALEALLAWPGAGHILALHPNHDAGRDGTLRALEQAAEKNPRRLRLARHLPRPKFVGLLKRLAGRGGLLVGNSSAALIEAAALRLPAVDIGPRQAGRERAGNIAPATEQPESIRAALEAASRLDRATLAHPYGDGHAGVRIADVLVRINPHDPRLTRKRNTY